MKSDGKNEAGRFLQVSGFKLQFDLTRPAGDRLLSAKVRNLEEDGITYKEMFDTEVYSVIMTEYLAGGGDGFNIIKNNKKRQLQGPLDTDILKDYLKIVSPIQTGLEDRISLVTIHDSSRSASYVIS